MMSLVINMNGEAAAAVHSETGHQLGIAQTDFILGFAHSRRERPDVAQRFWRDALSRFTAMGVPNANQVRGLLASV
jgi:hypothetical protein